MRVPAGVPSVFHSSAPWVPSEATNRTVPFTTVKPCAPDPLLPGLMSFTNAVPPGVPSVVQSSRP